MTCLSNWPEATDIHHGKEISYDHLHIKQYLRYCMFDLCTLPGGMLWIFAKLFLEWPETASNDQYVGDSN